MSDHPCTDLRYMRPDDRRTILIGRLTYELIEHDTGLNPDEIAPGEYEAWSRYVEDTLLPIIEPFLSTGRIVHGDDVG